MKLNGIVRHIYYSLPPPPDLKENSLPVRLYPHPLGEWLGLIPNRRLCGRHYGRMENGRGKF